MQMLAQLETITGRSAKHGLFVINMEYGRNFSGPDKDVFFYDRSVGHIEDAWQSNFLHPVIYYYRHLPTGELAPCRPPRMCLLEVGSPRTPLSVELSLLTPHAALSADGEGPLGDLPRDQMGQEVQE